MRGGYEGNPSARRQLGRVQAVAINRHWKQTSTSSTKYLSRALITRIFDCDSVAPFDQNTNNQVQCLLRAVHNHHLRRIADGSTRPSQVGADGFPQGNVPGCGTIIKLVNRRFPRAPQEDAPPHLKGESFQVAAPVSEVIREQTCAPLREIHLRPCCRC